MKEKSIAEHILTTPGSAAESLCSLHEMDPDTYRDLMKYARPNKKEEIKVDPVPRQVYRIDVGELSRNEALLAINNQMQIANTAIYNIGHTVSNTIPMSQFSNTVVHYTVTGHTINYARSLDCIHRKK